MENADAGDLYKGMTYWWNQEVHAALNGVQDHCNVCVYYFMLGWQKLKYRLMWSEVNIMLDNGGPSLRQQAWSPAFYSA